jgi:transposase
MSTKKELKLLTELLNLEGVKVSSHRQYEGIGIILQLESIAKESAIAAVQTAINYIRIVGR